MERERRLRIPRLSCVTPAQGTNCDIYSKAVSQLRRRLAHRELGVVVSSSSGGAVISSVGAVEKKMELETESLSIQGYFCCTT